MTGTDTTSSTVGFSPGAILRRKYRIERVLGRGGMGTVLEAVHLDLDRRVAIKVLHQELLDKADLVERFVREGRAASRIEGEHVARVFDVDRLEDETPFLVMELLDGQDLSFVRRTRAPLPIREAIDYVLQACTAVAQAHAAGVIHRDIKPANLFLAAEPNGSRRIKVLDFGISKIAGPLGASEPSVTRTTLVMGSVEYMSPEQMLSTRNVDARTDIWALGVVLFELLTGAAPFTGETPTQVCAHVMSQPAIRPRSLRPEIPDALEAIILGCLEKDRERRFATVDDLARALRAVVTHPSAPPEAFAPLGATVHSAPQPTTVLPDGVTGEVAIRYGGPASETAVGVATDPLPKLPRTSRVGWWLALVVAVSAATLGWFLWSSEEGRPLATSSAPPTAAPEPAPEACAAPPADLPPEIALEQPTLEPTSATVTAEPIGSAAPIASAPVPTKPAPRPSPAAASKPRPAPSSTPTRAEPPRPALTATSGID
jgi:serine/threonine-protein kinase